jgi:uncharacterized protein (DUF1697 family)
MAERRIFMVRAVNVGSTGQLPMAEWRALAEELGASEVSTYLRSGNLVCTPPPDVSPFERALEQGVTERFGFFREVVSRTRTELADALAAYPFADQAFGDHESKFAHIIFLVTQPAADAIASAQQVDTGDDEWAVLGRELFVRYARGAGTAHPGMVKVPKLLDVPGTARNLTTVQKLIDLAE